MELVSLTSEGRIILALKHGKHTYGELKFETGLSDRWLSIKLKELERKGIVEKEGKWYGLGREVGASGYELSLYMSFQAERMAEELGKLDGVKTIILFGGVGQGRAEEYSDLDMVIVVGNALENGRQEIMSKISELEADYHISIDPILLTQEDFMDNIRLGQGGIIYGLAEGWKVLVDKTGRIPQILQDRIGELRRSHDYLEEVSIWLKAK